MRFKYYLRGLGLGIIITTLILTISVHIRGGIMTDDRVVERATELGMVIPVETDEPEAEDATGSAQDAGLQSDTEAR